MIAENKNSPNVFNKMDTNKVDGRQDFAKNDIGFAKKMDGEQLDFTKIDDVQLFSMCKRFGEQARIWRQKFAGLLPEVLRRRLYERKGFESIFVFAKKLAGMSELQVRRVLNLDQKFEDKPILKNLLLNGEVSANKLARIASIATPENQEFLAEKAKILSQNALETLVRDERNAQQNFEISNESSGAQNLNIGNGNGFQKALFDIKSVRAHNLNLDEYVENELIKLQEKGININDLLRNFLQKREEEITAEKEQIAKEVLAKQDKLEHENELKNLIGIPAKKPSRYFNVKIKNVLKKEFGDKCSIPGCNKPAMINHHTQRFGISHNNDPRFLAPVCEQHHEIAHSIDQKYQQKRALAIAA